MTEVPLGDSARAISQSRDEINRAIARVLDSGHLILGPENEALASELSSFLGVPYTILVGNGTDALEIALRAVGVETGSKVITVANAGGYTSTALHLIGAEPVYVDIEPFTLQMSVDSLSSALNQLPQAPAGIVATHLYGISAPIQEIKEIADSRGIPLIEDCAQSLGAEVDGKKLGSFGHIATTSFYPTKNLGALGDGGAVFTANPELAERVRSLRQYGWDYRYHTKLRDGRNSRLDEIQAAVLRIRLPLLDSLTDRRRSIHAEYRSTENPWGYFPHQSGKGFVAHLAIMVTEDRQRLRSHFKSRGVQTGVHYPIPDHRQSPFDTGSRTDLRVTELMSERVVTIPLFPEMSELEVSRVMEVIRG